MSVTEMTTPSPRASLRIISVIIIVNVICMTAFISLTPLVTIQLLGVGYSNFMTSLQAVFAALGVIAFGRFYPTIAKHLGILPSLYVGLIGCAVLIGALAIMPIGPLWLIEAFFSGGCWGLFWSVSESWLSAVTPDKYRARVNALYALTIAIGASAGPLLLKLIGNQGVMPFVWIALIISASSLALIFLQGMPTHIEFKGRVRILHTVRNAGLVLVIGLVSGFSDNGVGAMFSVYVLRMGFSPEDLVHMLFAFGLGRLLLQMPVGFIADKFNRLLVLCVASTLCAAAVLSLPYVLGTALEFPVLFIWGGLIDTFYVLGLVIIGSRYSGLTLVEMNTLFVMLYSVGTAVGTPSLGLIMDQFGNDSFPIAVALVVSIAILAALSSIVNWQKLWGKKMIS